MAEDQQPLLLCMENMKGEEVTLAISPHDDFNAFLAKAKMILGFDVDLNSVTKNHPVQLTDNIYQFLIQNEAKTDEDQPGQTLEQMLEQSSTDLVYILDDGTQINASQIHFDNDDLFTDLTKESIPFVKNTDCVEEIPEDKNVEEDKTKKLNILASPVVAQNSNFINSVPFKLVCSNTSGFEAQFIKHLQGKTYTTLNTVVTKKSPKTLIKDNYRKYVNEVKKAESLKPFSRDDIVNMMKDSPVVIPNNMREKRRHNIRKTNPLPIYKKPKPYIDLPYFPIGNLESQDCLICSKYVDNTLERLYIFDKEDQKLHRSSPQKRRLTQLKILCQFCLTSNFQQCPIETQNRALNSDEYLIIRNNQQYIYRLTNPSCFRKEIQIPEVTKVAITNVPVESLKAVETVVAKEEKIIDIEIIDQTTDIDQVIENLEEADEDVKVFLGKYQECFDKDLVCRFCQQTFTEIQSVIDHGSEHKHDLDDGEVYPCPLCDYGYADFKWLKGHIKAAHERSEKSTDKDNDSKTVNNEDCIDNTKNIDPKISDNVDTKEPKSPIKTTSPIAKRTRSSTKKKENGDEIEIEEEITQENKEDDGDNVGKSTTETDSHVISTEVKQECMDSDDAIWIVHTDDSDLDQRGAKVEKHKKVDPFSHKCLNCDKLFKNAEALTMHRCVKNGGTKRKSFSDDEEEVCIPSKQDFLKRAHGKAKKPKEDGEQKSEKAKEKNYGPTTDATIVTCHNCNESFNSKVRLKFHMQFHSGAWARAADGQYRCARCPRTLPAERELFDHVHFAHLARKRWQCPLPSCKKTFRLRATLTKHSRIHTDTRRYVCPTCDKRFLDKQTLDEHSVTHLQTKPFQCHICMKQLTRRSRLRMHLRAHEELTPTALLVCGRCHRAFRDQAEVEEHAQTSSSCLYEMASELKQGSEDVKLSPSSGIITKTISPSVRAVPRAASPPTAARLLRGLGGGARALARVARADRAFRCEYCEDVFYTEEGLNKHRAIHKGVKNPFTCHICKVSFATYSRCTTHKTTHGFYKRPVEKQDSEPKSGQTNQDILGYGDFPVAKHFLCEDCGRSYLHWTYLQVHRRMKHGTDNFVYKCNSCELTFPNSWSVSYHRKKAHGKTTQEDENGVTKISKTDYRIPCRDCDEFLPNKTALYKHRNKEHSDLSLLEDKPEIFWCMACGSKFQSRTAMAAHNARCNNLTENVRKQDKSNVTSRLRSARRNKNRTETKQTNTEMILVIEFEGLDPSPEAILARLTENNVDFDKIIEINKISIPKGVKSVIPTTERALKFISSRQRKSKNENQSSENSTQYLSQPSPSATTEATQPIPVHSSEDTAHTDGQTDEPLVVNKGESVTGQKEPLSDINVSSLLRDGVNMEQNSPLHFDETLL